MAIIIGSDEAGKRLKEVIKSVLIQTINMMLLT